MIGDGNAGDDFIPLPPLPVLLLLFGLHSGELTGDPNVLTMFLDFVIVVVGGDVGGSSMVVAFLI